MLHVDMKRLRLFLLHSKASLELHCNVSVVTWLFDQQAVLFLFTFLIQHGAENFIQQDSYLV